MRCFPAARLFEACYGVAVDPTAISVPTLLIHGSHDRIVPLASAEQLAETIPDAVLHVLEGIGHTPTVTAAPTAVAIIEE